jgi:hypothetical protein
VAAAALAGAWFVLARVGSRRDLVEEITVGREVGLLAACGVVTVLGIHAGADFDWDYGLLAVLLATGIGVLHAARPPAHAPAAWLARLSAALLLGATALAVSIGFLGHPPQDAPWRFDLTTTQQAVRDGDLATARADLDRLRRWNPGSPALPVLGAAIDLRDGLSGPDRLGAFVRTRTLPSHTQLFAAEELLRADGVEEASNVLERLVPVLDARRAWGVQAPVFETARLRLATAHAAGGCEAVVAALPEVSAWVEDHGLSTPEVLTAAELPCAAAR